MMGVGVFIIHSNVHEKEEGLQVHDWKFGQVGLVSAG
jgi:hypothetical protein